MSTSNTGGIGPKRTEGRKSTETPPNDKTVAKQTPKSAATANKAGTKPAEKQERIASEDATTGVKGRTASQIKRVSGYNFDDLDVSQLKNPTSGVILTAAARSYKGETKFDPDLPAAELLAYKINPQAVQIAANPA